MTLLDQAGKVRSGEELPLEQITAFLNNAGMNLNGIPELSQFPGGASNLTYLLKYADAELILRRPPIGHKAKSAHDMVREAKLMQALKPVYNYVPKVLAICEDSTIMGCDFYVMERIHGIIPRQNMPESLNLTVQDTHTLCLNVIDKMIALHQIDYQAAGLQGLGRGAGYVQRQISGWSERAVQAKTDNSADFSEIVAWLEQHKPAQDAATCLIHNDFRFDNVVLNPQNPLEVIGVLDWEMATLGDPLMDLGNTLAYWAQSDDDAIFLSMRRQPTHLPGMLTRQEVIAYYLEKMGLEVENSDFYVIFGLFRLAIIIQQIYYRYHHGQNKNPQFAEFVNITNYLQKRCLKLIANYSRG
ncbi:putative aminoglycoside phosphotransferase [Solimicrobium silvestre]|uniref:Putative aminoglycoside phosphotransferase n=2 Tax=Solimicrobium silvestre TaxID=2099400 RepID=A0A2S9H4W3_9BURK|nr:phosphotransferase family protein [Solimicrobium silvestre]PRC95024.1 putative aminoglycoside phosphotransferase [Solimicrobium silvestre]